MTQITVVKGSEHYYVLICDDSKYAPKTVQNRLICGVYATKEEAKTAKEGIKDCVLKHYIKKCSVTVKYV